MFLTVFCLACHFSFLIVLVSNRNPSELQRNQAIAQQHCLDLSPLSAVLTLLLYEPRASTLGASTSLLLPRSLPTCFHLDRCRRASTSIAEQAGTARPDAPRHSGLVGGEAPRTLLSNKLPYFILSNPFSTDQPRLSIFHPRAIGTTPNRNLGSQNPQLVILLKRQPIIVLLTIPINCPFTFACARTLLVPFPAHVDTNQNAHSLLSTEPILYKP